MKKKKKNLRNCIKFDKAVYISRKQVSFMQAKVVVKEIALKQSIGILVLRTPS